MPTAVRRALKRPILDEFAAPQTDVNKLALRLKAEPKSIPSIVGLAASNTARSRFRAARTLCVLSELSARLLYPYFERLVPLLDRGNAFLRWDVIRILGNLAAVDHQEKLELVLDRLLAPINHHEMIGAAISMQAAARIAQAKPHLADVLAGKILQVERATYKTPQCRNLAIGHALVALGQFYPAIHHMREQVLEFVERQKKNPLAATRKKAELFLKKIV